MTTYIQVTALNERTQNIIHKHGYISEPNHKNIVLFENDNSFYNLLAEYNIQEDTDFYMEEIETYVQDDINRMYVDFVLPEIIEVYETDGQIDRPARCEGYNNFVDMLQKNRELNEILAFHIGIPDDIENNSLAYCRSAYC